MCFEMVGELEWLRAFEEHSLAGEHLIKRQQEIRGQEIRGRRSIHFQNSIAASSSRFLRGRPKARRVEHQILGQKLMGHYAYHGTTDNTERLAAFRDAVQRLWRKWLGRRNRLGPMNWSRFHEFLTRYTLPRVRVVHSMMGLAAKP